MTQEACRSPTVGTAVGARRSRRPRTADARRRTARHPTSPADKRRPRTSCTRSIIGHLNCCLSAPRGWVADGAPGASRPAGCRDRRWSPFPDQIPVATALRRQRRRHSAVIAARRCAIGPVGLLGDLFADDTAGEPAGHCEPSVDHPGKSVPAASRAHPGELAEDKGRPPRSQAVRDPLTPMS